MHWQFAAAGKRDGREPVSSRGSPCFPSRNVANIRSEEASEHIDGFRTRSKVLEQTQPRAVVEENVNLPVRVANSESRKRKREPEQAPTELTETGSNPVLVRAVVYRDAEDGQIVDNRDSEVENSFSRDTSAQAREAEEAE